MFMFLDLVGAVEQLRDNDIFTDKRTSEGSNASERNHVAAVSFWPCVLLHYDGQHKELL